MKRGSRDVGLGRGTGVRATYGSGSGIGKWALWIGVGHQPVFNVFSNGRRIGRVRSADNE